ncbi:porphobilinogen deaminase [beta proteobacterium AAP99]|nr:porphobilinogen deaminase [beta proteobacterium AAP99]
MPAPSSPKRLVIATRESRLALWQAEHIAARLKALYPDCEVRLQPMTTRGDNILDRTLSAVGGKGLFIKELEVALLEGRADLAVHSLKDVPMELEPEFKLTAITEREDPRDALVGADDLASLPGGSVVGTSSLRRQAWILSKYPQLKIESLRGNLDTRLAKLDRGQYRCIVLAAAGLKRLGYTDRIRHIMSPEDMLPAAGQGALGIECLASRMDVQAALAPLADARTTACVLAERAVSRTLGGSCSMPLAAHAVHTDDGLVHIRAWVGATDGSEQRAQSATQQPGETAEALGQRVGRALIEAGALAIVAPATPDA